MNSSENLASLRPAPQSGGRGLRAELNDAVEEMREEMRFLLQNMRRSLQGRFRAARARLNAAQEQGPRQFFVFRWGARAAACLRCGIALAFFPCAYALAAAILLFCYAAAAVLFLLFMIPMAMTRVAE